MDWSQGRNGEHGHCFLKQYVYQGPKSECKLDTTFFSPIITEEMNDAICCPFSEQEISDALFRLVP